MSMATSPDLLSSLLSAFQAVLALGMHSATGATVSLFRILATIEIAALGIWWWWSGNNAMGYLVARVFMIGVLLWMMQDWQWIVGSLQAGFMKLGIVLGGSHLTLGPTHSAGMALIDKGTELALAIQGYTSTTSRLEKVVDIILMPHPILNPVPMSKLVTAWAVALAFLVAGIHVFAVQLGFVFYSAIAFITTPFAVWHRSAWISEKTFGGVISMAVKLAFLYALASASIPVLKQYVAPKNPSMQECLYMLGAGLLILFLQWAAHSLANGILSGMPSLTHNDVTPRPGAVISLSTTTISMLAHTMSSAARHDAQNGTQVPPARRP